MRVRSLLKTLFIWTVLTLLATTCVMAQKLAIQDVTVDDTILPYECGTHGWIYYKGNGDHAFSPGERVRLYLTVKNQTGYQITAMSGTLFDYDDHLNTYSYNCYSGGEGIPYSVPIENGAVGSANGNFIVELTQDISCGGFVELGVTFNYTTSQGSFSEVHYFSVPVFSLDTFVPTPDASIVESSNDRQISALATSTRSIGIFYRQDALVSEPDDGEYFAELNLDGILTSGPTFISSEPYDESQSAALWNATEKAYQLLTPSPTADMQVISMGSSMTTTQVYLPQGTANKISSAYYDAETFSTDTMTLLAQGSMGQAYFCRRIASSPYNAADWMYGYQDAGYLELPRPNTSCMIYDSSIGYVPGLGSKPPYYFLAVEYHGGGVDVIRVYRINAAYFYEFDTGNGGGDDYYDIAIGSDFTANPVSPSLVVDPTPVFNGTNFQRTVVLAFKNDNSANSILATIFSENLSPISSNVQMTPHTGYPMDESDCPSLAFSCGRIYMVNRERSYSVGGFSYASRVQVGAYDPYHGSSGGVWTPVQSEYVSETWINQENLTCLGVLDKNYVFWDDSRGTALEPLFSIHYSEARCLDDAAPYNMSVLDDTIISQPFEYSLHPSVACREADNNPMYPRAADCMAVWEHSNDGGTTYDIYRTSLMPVAAPVDEWPQAITTGGAARSGARPSVYVYNNDYKVFWMTPGFIWKYSYTGSGSQPNGFQITTVTDTNGEFLDVSPVADYTDIVLLKDWRYPYGGENSYNLWAVQSFGSPSAVVEANLTQYPDGNVELLSGKVTRLEGVSVEGAGGPYYPFAAVAWLEKQNIAPQETRLKFGYLYQYCDQVEPWACHLAFVPGYPVTLQTWSLGANPVNVYDFSMSANEYVASMLVSYKYSASNDAKLALFNYQHPVGYSLLTLSPATLPDAIIGSSYSQSLSANGTNPINYTLTAGMLPQGLLMSSYGAITGYPTMSGTYEFTVTATDAVGRSGQRIYSITVGYSGAVYSTSDRSGSAGSVEESSSRAELIGFVENGAAILREMTYASGNPFKHPRLKVNGTHFDYSWTEEGASYGTCGGERLFFAGRLDQFGCPLAWPVRVASPLSDCYTLPSAEANYQVASTNTGTVAVYFQGAGQMASNIYATALSWDDSSTDCSIYNQAPVITSIGGPYTINYGEGVILTGTAIDDTALGDYIALAGWDITGDGTADFSFLGPDPDLTLSLTFQQLKQKNVDTPREAIYPVSLKVTDRRGLTDTKSTSIKIQDTTPPVVKLAFPDGGETLRAGGVYTILWSASDNYQLNSVDLYYCTDWGATTPNWIKINSSPIPVTQSSYDWTIPSSLSSTCRVKVVATDKGVPTALTTEDPSDENFYIVQATTSSIKTLILRSNNRINQFYPGQAVLVGEKLSKLIVNGKVTGFIVEVDSIPGLSGPTGLYKVWDDDTTNIDKANAVADAIRNYVKNLVRTDYTNVEYLVIVGDDRIVPFYRVHDATPGAYSENDYAGSVDCATATGGAICQDYYLTDNIYGDIGYWNGESWEEYETTTEGSNFMALPDLAIGRLVETPEQIATTIDAFITMDGQVTLDSLTTANVFVSGYDFLNDSATTINDKYDTPYAVDNLLGGAWTHDQLETALFVGLQTPTPHPYVLNSLNGHCTHYTLETPNGGPLPTTEMEADYPGKSLDGRVFYNVGCHSGLNVPSSFTNSYDLPEMMMEKGAIAYVGNTGYGWGLKHGTGYTEKLMEMITDKMLLQQMVSLGQALTQAKREYFIQDKRYDVFDEKVLFESTLYGLPMYRIVMSQSSIIAPKDFSGTAGPDHEEVNGISLDKKLIKADKSNLLPTGVTELALNFEFGPGTHQLVHTADGDYYKLNGRMNGEAGDSLQPLFIYESRLSGVVSHGVIFTGGTFTNYADFEPVIATPESSSPLVPPEPIAPICGTFIPTVNVAHPQLPSSLVSTDLTKLTVYTGYFKKYTGDEITQGTETLFNTVGFSVYYSNSSDKTPPAFPSPPAEGGDYHTLTGTNCLFSVQASDSGTGLYRVLVTYSDNTSSWQSLDLTYNGSSLRWEGSLTLSKSVSYFVQAVDNAGNCKVLKSNEGMSGINPATGLPYVVAARLFEVEFLDNDSDGMPNDWETANGTNPNVADANDDPDGDNLTNIQEMNNHTNPQDDDTDNDGMKDGWEVAKGLNPLANDAALDPDHDSLTNLDEQTANTNPYDADTDDDSMPDGWEVTYGLNPLVIDNDGDGDFDGLDNGEEYAASTKPTVDDTDGDGDNDGSELNHGRNPLSAGDGKRITISETLDGDDVIINWPSGSGDNGVIDGSYWIYRSTVPYHGAADELVTTPLPLEDGTTTYRDVGAAGGTETYFYTVTNSRFTAPAPAIGAVVPSSGPVGTTISIYGSNFVIGATVRIGGVTAGSIVVQNASWITCAAPSNSLGAKDVTVTNPNGQFVTKTGGFTYTP